MLITMEKEVELPMSRLSSPTCEDLGIPADGLTARLDMSACADHDHHTSGVGHHPSAHALPAEQMFHMSGRSNPFSPYCRIPLPNTFGLLEQGFEPAFIRKRNERERERVRCVNDGYSRLREHLPLENKDKRTSKVETLRSAIRYIEYMKFVLNRDAESNRENNEADHDGKCCAQDHDECSPPTKKRCTRDLRMGAKKHH